MNKFLINLIDSIEVEKGFDGLSNVILKENKEKDIEVALGVKGKDLYIIFKGSDSFTNWFYDFLFFKKSIAYNNTKSKIKLHLGFYLSYLSVREEIHNYAKNFSDIENVICMGHSLGGALATLCVVDMQFNGFGKNYICYSCGSPKVGNKAFIKSFNKRIKNSFRYVNGNDIVTHLPFSLLGFRHVHGKIQIGKRKLFPSFNDHFFAEYKLNFKV